MLAEKLSVMHYGFGKLVSAMVAVRLAELWAGVDRDNISGSWAERLPDAVATMTAGQEILASDSAGYVNSTMIAQSITPEGPMLIPSAFAGVAASGMELTALLSFPAFTALQGLRGGATIERSMGAGLNQLLLMGQTESADSHRVADGVTIASRKVSMGYVRMVEPGACSRCIILAGMFYRWNDGFNRHPGCNCRHIPASENVADNLTTDPYKLFYSLSEEEQNKRFSKAGAQTIRDGGDIYQAVNYRRGMNVAGMKTTEGTTSRGNFGKKIRLTPEAIYELNGTNRAAAIVDLQKYGYILPGGQVSGGLIRGRVEGYGQLGHGGTYPAARARIENAREFGRVEGDRWTMTAAERRLHDATNRWELVQQGINPYGNPTMTPRAAYSAPPLTPAIAQQIENDYRRWLATKGQIFAK